MTPQGLSELKEEYRQLKEVKRPQVIEEVNELRSLGDLKENEAYHQARKRQAFIDGRLKELEEILKNAEVRTKSDSDTVQLGSRVRVSLGEEEMEYTIVGNEEADTFKGKISLSSPLGKKLLDQKKGDRVSVEAPGGEIEYRILEIN